MSDQKTYMKHVNLDVVISVDRTSDTTVYGYDTHGEYRGFKREKLTPSRPMSKLGCWCGMHERKEQP